MSNNLVFTPENFDSVISIEDLVNILDSIIKRIRSQDGQFNQIISDIEELQNLAENGMDVDASVSTLFSIYKKIQSISLKLRKELNSYVNLDIYDSVEYAFYYNNERFFTDKLSLDWMFVNSKGELRLSLDKATADLKTELEKTGKQKINQIFNRHYEQYVKAISGMYKGTIGRGRLNRGHIAEAYEIHISQHHTRAYSLLNNVIENTSILDQMTNILELEIHGSEYWSNHEDANEAWRHIRNALGTQRGTVAGDVGKFQVKQGRFSEKNQYSSEVRLSSLTNLKHGVSIYNRLLNPTVPSHVVAREIAMYLSEPVKKTEQNIQAYIANKEIGPEINKLTLLRHL